MSCGYKSYRGENKTRYRDLKILEIGNVCWYYFLQSGSHQVILRRKAWPILLLNHHSSYWGKTCHWGGKLNWERKVSSYQNNQDKK